MFVNIELDKCFSMRVVVNGVNQTGPLLYLVSNRELFSAPCYILHINDKTADIESDIRLYADDCVCYREIKDKDDTSKLQRDIDRLANWARKWGMRIQPVKCNIMQLTRKY